MSSNSDLQIHTPVNSVFHFPFPCSAAFLTPPVSYADMSGTESAVKHLAFHLMLSKLIRQVLSCIYRMGKAKMNGSLIGLPKLSIQVRIIQTHRVHIPYSCVLGLS